MLDIRFIRENAERVQTAATQKGYQVSIAQLLELDDSRRTLQRQVDELRQKRNEIAAKMKNGQPEQTLIDQGKQIKTELVELEEHLKKVDTECIASIKTVPNVTADDVPLGGEADSVEVKRWGVFQHPQVVLVARLRSLPRSVAPHVLHLRDS